MTTMKKGDRVRLIGNVAYGPPDRRDCAGTVVNVVDDGTAIARLNVIFDGEEAVDEGRVQAHFELVG